jgi:hypothetical protein
MRRNGMIDTFVVDGVRYGNAGKIISGSTSAKYCSEISIGDKK